MIDISEALQEIDAEKSAIRLEMNFYRRLGHGAKSDRDRHLCKVICNKYRQHLNRINGIAKKYLQFSGRPHNFRIVQ